MNKAIDELREHFNQRPVPSSKVLVEERDRVNAMIDAVEAENANLRKAAEFEHNQLEDIKRAVDMILEEHVAMLAENAKLRELFYETWEWMQRARYDRSIRANEMDDIGVKAVKLGFPDYELGIEV